MSCRENIIITIVPGSSGSKSSSTSRVSCCRCRDTSTQATPEYKSIHWTLSSACKSASKVVLGRMQLTLHATCPTRHTTTAMHDTRPPSTRSAPSRHCTDARVYGNTATAIHDMSTPSPPPAPNPTYAVSALYGCARVYGHTATAMHDMSTPRPPPKPQRSYVAVAVR